MWEMRATDYFTYEPTEDWHATTEAFFWHNMGAKWRRSNSTKAYIVDWFKNHPGDIFPAGFNEFRYTSEGLTNEQLETEAMKLAMVLSKARHQEFARCDRSIDYQYTARLERLFQKAADRWRRRAGFTK